MNDAYISLGSNIEPEVNLPRALQELRAFGKLTAVSFAWRSTAIGANGLPMRDGQSDYLNAAALLRTPFSACELKLNHLSALEDRLGRQRDPQNKFAARPIDLDIVLFNQDVLSIEHREIPDPEIPLRSFLAIPLAEIAPDYQHPVLQQSLQQIADNLPAAAVPLELVAELNLKAFVSV